VGGAPVGEGAKLVAFGAVGGAPVGEGAKLVAFGAACEGQRADRPGPQQDTLAAHVSSALDCTRLSSRM